ncbi:hypothetical protein CH063_10935, partial [Colletotrichum higginsianum]
MCDVAGISNIHSGRVPPNKGERNRAVASPFLHFTLAALNTTSVTFSLLSIGHKSRHGQTG